MTSTMLSCALAVTLITSPSDLTEGLPPQPESSVPFFWHIRGELCQAAVSMEVLDKREARYWFMEPSSFSHDLKRIRERYAELRDAPPIADCARFPERKVIQGWMELNRVWRDRMSNWASSGTWHAEEIQDAITIAEKYYRLWDYVYDAQCEYYYVTPRRRALQNLRNEIGFYRYYTNQMPPPVPLQYFTSLD